MITPVIIDYNSNLRNDNNNTSHSPNLTKLFLCQVTWHQRHGLPDSFRAFFVSSASYSWRCLSQPLAKFGFGRKVSHVMTHQVCEDVILHGKTGWEIDIRAVHGGSLYCKEGSLCITMYFYVLATWNEQYVIVSWPSAKVVGNAMSQTWSDRHRILLVTRARQRLKNWGVSAGALIQMEGTDGHGGSSRNCGIVSGIL